MKREPGLGKGNPRLHSALNHPPHYRTLQPSKGEQRQHSRDRFSFDGSRPCKEHEWQQKHRANKAAKYTVRPFPPVDGFELPKRHATVFKPVLRNTLVFSELLLPAEVSRGRQNSGDRPPLCNREAGTGQARKTTNDHHRRNECRDDNKPPAHPASRRGNGGVGGDLNGHVVLIAASRGSVHAAERG